MKNLRVSGNMLKILALFSMTIDHVGLILMHNYEPFRIVGRLAFPIFAYMIAEGCHYTRDRRRHFAGIFGLGIVCQLFYYLVDHSVYQGILMTFSMSILIIYALDETAGIWRGFVALLAMGAAIFVCVELPKLLEGTGYAVDYGLWGVMLPVWISMGRTRKSKWFLAAAGLLLVSLDLGGRQWYSLFSLIPLWFYSGEKGKWRTKYLFYVYYPLHMAAIYGISLLL